MTWHLSSVCWTFSYEKNLLHRWWPQSTYIRRVQSCVCRLPKYWPPTPLSTQRVCPPPALKAGGTHLPDGDGGGESIFWKTPAIGLASYSTIISLRWWPRKWKEGFNKTHFLLEQKTLDKLLYTKNGSGRGLARNRVSTEFRRHGIPRNFLTSEVISAQFRIPRNAKMSLPWTPYS
jgi:hypothetical protein